jgi:Tfp pilus assembly PilM family ATPase
MALGFFKSSVAPVAIDFGYGELKLLQVHPGEPATLIAAAREVIPELVRNDPMARQNYLAEVLPRLIRDGGFKGKTAICSIPAWQTFVQHMQVRGGDGSGVITEQLKQQLQAIIACDPHNVVVRHVEVGEVFKDNQQMTEVICFAVARDVVMRQIELLNKCRMEIGGFHAEPIAVVKSFDHLFRREGDDQITTLYVDLGASCTKAMISHGKEICFAKTIPVGGRHLDQRLAELLNCEVATARARRHAMAKSAAPIGSRAAAGIGAVGVGAGCSANTGPGATGTADDRRVGSVPREFAPVHDGSSDQGAGADAGADSDSVARQAVEPLIEQLIDELRMCERYHRRLFESRSLDRIVFVGGESMDRSLCREIAEAIGVVTYQGNPFGRLHRNGEERFVGFDGTHAEPGWSVALGLCACPANG